MSHEISQQDLNDIRRSLDGDEQAYGLLVSRYQRQVAAQMWRFTRDRGVLEELVQDVFIQAYWSLRRYRAEAPFLHWLRRIATRVGYRYWRSRDKDTRMRSKAIQQWREEARLSSTPSEAAECLHELLERLQAADRLVLTLLYFEECGVKEIARRTGWNVALVKVRAHRARKRLQSLLEEAGFGR